MKKTDSVWVLGQKITFHPTTGDYDLIVCETPAGSQGPPPHIHSRYKEAFLIVEGEMEFFVNGNTKTLKAGESLDVPPGTLHTFNNKSDKKCVWVNIHSPKGFTEFFETYGISDSEDDAIAKSVNMEIVQKVLETAKDFDMTIPEMPPV
ncbi:cupin domain-containing protein [Flagellimonas sp.]|uniref:cupin domain-containing protein n=1 Tax=Flagellimonas sp. TaxID=2058762 RepID=UPI003B5965F3